MAANSQLASAQSGFEIQHSLSEFNQAVASIDVEVMKLKRLLATPPTAKDYGSKRAQCVNNLKQIAVAVHNHGTTLKELTARKDGDAAARSSIVNGYAAEFYGGRRIENFENAVNSFPLKAGAGDAEAFKQLATVAENLKTGLDRLRAQLAK